MAVTKKEDKAQVKAKIIKKQILADHSLKALWADDIQLALRDDDICFIRFSTHLPEGYYEQCRIMLSKKNIEKFVEVACEVLNYYPSPKQEKVTELPE